MEGGHLCAGGGDEARVALPLRLGMTVCQGLTERLAASGAAGTGGAGVVPGVLLAAAKRGKQWLWQPSDAAVLGVGALVKSVEAARGDEGAEAPMAVGEAEAPTAVAGGSE